MPSRVTFYLRSINPSHHRQQLFREKEPSNQDGTENRRSGLLTIQQQTLGIEHQTVSRGRKKVCNIASSLESAQLKEALVRPERLSDKFGSSCFTLSSYDNRLKEAAQEQVSCEGSD